MSGVPRQVIVAAVIARGGRILIAQRDRGSLAGMWEFPGGKREPGETDGEALRREIHEELGIAIEVGDPAAQVVDGPRELRFFHCTYPGRGRPRALGCAQFRWVLPEDLPGHTFPAPNRELVAHLAVTPRVLPPAADRR